MKWFLSGMALVTTLAAPVAAETRYDRNLEKAVMDIVASKMGSIRDGFSYKQVPQMVVPSGGEPVPAEPRAQASNNDGLMPAVERPVF